MNTKLYNDKPFIVTIDRSTAERGYVLRIIDNDGSFTAQNEPLKRDDFVSEFKFDPTWPHESYETGTN